MRHVAAFVLPRHAGIISPSAPPPRITLKALVARSGLDTRERKRGGGGGECDPTDVCSRAFLIMFQLHTPNGGFQFYVLSITSHCVLSIPYFFCCCFSSCQCVELYRAVLNVISFSTFEASVEVFELSFSYFMTPSTPQPTRYTYFIQTLQKLNKTHLNCLASLSTVPTIISL